MRFMARTYGSEWPCIRQDVRIAEVQPRDYQARLGTPSPVTPPCAA
jgi:hypothetical protein